MSILEDVALHDCQARALEDWEPTDKRIGVEIDIPAQREAIESTQAADLRIIGATGFVGYVGHNIDCGLYCILTTIHAARIVR